MPHPLVEQLRFARSEFRRGLADLDGADARRRLLPMNCISWNVGHLAWQEQRYFFWYAQGRMLRPELNELFAYGASASTPELAEMWAAWEEITHVVDPWLDALTTEMLQGHVVRDGRPSRFIWGSLMLRTTYHYWYHNGENQAIRQQLGHERLAEFVGDIDTEAPYRPE